MTTDFAHYRHHALLLISIAALGLPATAKAFDKLGDKPFLKAIISNPHPFTGQEILLTYRLYFKEFAPKIERETPPSLPAVWAKENLPERFIKSIPETISGIPFRSAIVKQFKVVPLQSGNIIISGYTMLCILPEPESSSGVTKIGEQRIRLTAPAVTILAKSIPEPVPAGFTGAVGSFAIHFSADRERLQIGEPVSLTLTLTGVGSLHTLELPALLLPESFRHNSPERTIKLDNRSGSEVTSGTISATITAWPQSEGVFKIDPTPLFVFNPETGKFTTLISKPITITVTAAHISRLNNRTDTIQPKMESLSSRFTTYLTGIVLLIITLTCIIVIRRKKILNASSSNKNTGSAQAPQTGSITSALEIKQQLFMLLEKAGIKNPGALTRKELDSLLQCNKISDNICCAIPEVLDALDKIIYSPTEKKDARIPDRIAIKITALLEALKEVAPPH